MAEQIFRGNRRPGDNWPTGRTFTRASGLLDLDGLKTSFATVAGIATLLPVSFNGAEATLLNASSGPARSIIITGSAAPGAYVNGSTIVVTGQRGTDAAVTETFTITGTGGPYTFRGSNLYDTISSVVIGAQALLTGAWQLGVADAAPALGCVFQGVRMAAGTLWLRYGSSADLDDSIVLAAERLEEIQIARILAGSDAAKITTAVATTVYF
jgi:hypothetical protein